MFKQAPNQAQSLKQAESRQSAGVFSGAIAAYRELLKQSPNVKGLLYRLGAAERMLGHSNQARDHLRKAIRLGANEPGVFHELALTYKQQGRFDEAHQALQKALKTHASNAGLLAAQAELFLSQGEPDRAWSVIESAVGASSIELPIIMTYALLAPRFGKHEHAAGLLHSAIDQFSLPQAVLIDALFRLGQLYDGIGEFERAFQTFEKANKLKAGDFNPDEVTQAASALIYRWTQNRFQALPRSAISNDHPTFIVGMPRSGTTLVEQIVASHPEVFGGGELDAIPRLVYEWQQGMAGPVPLMIDLSMMKQPNIDRASRAYLDESRRNAGSSTRRWTDKMPLNCLHLGLIAKLFPRSRIIHCRRDPMDTCLSCYFHHFSGRIPFAYDLSHLGRFYREYVRITDHWHHLIDIPILDVHYGELVDNVESESRRVVEFLGLTWDERCLRFHETRRTVLTSSQNQVRQPVYRTSLERWRSYEKHLGPLSEALGRA